ncbi:MAG: hydroxymethylbilane synthase [Candidatus Sumerlaeia bacterium]|nr:hydroxymethylbilane synthase [Candidatus Sumerlaeia bacterium]
MIVRIGSRGSQLALTQSRTVAEALRRAHPGLETDITIIQTQGDRVLDASLAAIGGKGVFTREIEHALLDGRIDLAVHSLKDLPTAQPPGLALGATPPRVSWRDVLVAPRPLSLEQLEAGTVIGTSSLRRAAQLRARFPHLEVRDIRGNVPTRVRKMLDGQFAAIVLAEAGLSRLGLEPPYVCALDSAWMLPAPGQGALGLQIRAADERMATLLAALDDATTRACVTAERTLLDRLGGGCQVPLGALAERLEDGRLRLRGRVLAADASVVLECDLTGAFDAPEELGARAAEDLHARGAVELIACASRPPAAASDDQPTSEARERRVVVTRDEDADGPLSRELRACGLTPVCLPLVRTRVLANPSPFAAIAGAAPFAWTLVTSAMAVEALRAAPEAARDCLRTTRWACVGAGTAEALRALGHEADLIGTAGREELLAALAQAWPAGERAGARVLVLRGTLAPTRLADQTRAWGCDVVDLVVYETVLLAENAGLLAQLLRGGACQAVAFCSPSAVDSFAACAGDLAHGVVLGSIGATTSRQIEQAGLGPVVEAPEASFASLARRLAEALV